MIELMLVRHGNTFGPGDKVRWVGSGEDLPLVESGREQARTLGEALGAADWRPTACVSGGLVRQTEHLALASGGTPAPTRDAALDELDYGPWGGLSTAEIEARFGPDDVAGWNERSAWPSSVEWPESLESVRNRVRRFAREVAAGAHGPRVLACSSNGLLRWFLELVPGRFEAALADGTFKVRTGHVGMLRVTDAGAWDVLSWNRPPDAPLP